MRRRSLESSSPLPSRCVGARRARPRPSCASSPPSRRSPISAGRWAATGSTSRRCRAATRTRTSSRPSRRWCSRSTAPTRWSTSGSTWRSAGCRRWCSRRATRASSAGSPGTSTPRRRSARGRPERARRPAARARRHPPARQPALLDPARERARHRARCSPSAHGARRRRGGDLQGGARRASRRALDAKEKEWDGRRGAAARHARWSPTTRAGRTWRGGSGCRRSATSSPSPGIPPTAESHRAADRADEEVGREAGDGRVVLPEQMARFVADNGKARLVSAPSDVGATPAIKTYFDLVDAVIAALRGGRAHTARARART